MSQCQYIFFFLSRLFWRLFLTCKFFVCTQRDRERETKTSFDHSENIYNNAEFDVSVLHLKNKILYNRCLSVLIGVHTCNVVVAGFVRSHRFESSIECFSNENWPRNANRDKTHSPQKESRWTSESLTHASSDFHFHDISSPYNSTQPNARNLSHPS